MNRFRKIFHHIKSDKIDEKIKSLDKEMERTGMVLGEVTMPMSTDNLYKIFNYANTPAVDQETSTVPDSTGFADGSSQDVNGGDESDSSTWDTGWNNTTDMSNPNELNGETDRPIPITPDLSGWDGSYVSANGNTGLGGYRGIGVWTISSGIGGGKSIGTLDSGNHFIQILVPDNIFSSYNYPVDQRGPLAGGSYGSYTNTEFAAAQNIASAYEAKKDLGSVVRKVWVNFDQATAHGGPSYAEYTGAKKTTTVDGHTKYWMLKNVSILSYVNPYTSQDATPEVFSQVLSREYGAGSSYFPGNVGKLMDFLKGSLEVGKEAFDFLMDKAKGVGDLKSIEKEEQQKKDKKEFGLSFSNALKLAGIDFSKDKDQELQKTAEVMRDISPDDYAGGSAAAIKDAEAIDKVYNQYAKTGETPTTDALADKFFKDNIPGYSTVVDFIDKLPWNDPANPVGAWIDNNEWWVEPLIGALAGAVAGGNAYKTPYNVPASRITAWKNTKPTKGPDGKLTNLQLYNAKGNLIGKKFINPKTGKWETMMRPTDRSSISDKARWEFDQMQHTNASVKNYETTGQNPSIKDLDSTRLVRDPKAPGSMSSGPTVGSQWAIDKATGATAGAIGASVDDKITELGDKLVSDVLSDEPPKQAAMGELGVSGELTDMVNIPPEDLKNISAEILDKGHFVDNFADALNNVKDTIVDTGRAGKLFFDYLTNNLPDVIDVDYLGQEYVDKAFASAQIKDGVVFVGDNIIGTGQAPEYDAETREIVIRFNYDFKKNADEFASNKDKMTWMQKTFGQALYNSIGEYSMDASIKFGPGPIGALMGLLTGSVMGKAVNLSKLLGGGKHKTGEIRMSAEKVKEMFKDGPASKNFYYQALSMDEVLMEAELQKYDKLSQEDAEDQAWSLFSDKNIDQEQLYDVFDEVYEENEGFKRATEESQAIIDGVKTAQEEYNEAASAWSNAFMDNKYTGTKGWLNLPDEQRFEKADMSGDYQTYAADKEFVEKWKADAKKGANVYEIGYNYAEKQPAFKQSRQAYDDHEKVLDKLSSDRAAAYNAVTSFFSGLAPHPNPELARMGYFDCDINCMSKKIKLENAAKEAAAKEDKGQKKRESLWNSHISTRNSLRDEYVDRDMNQLNLSIKANDTIRTKIKDMKKVYDEKKKVSEQLRKTEKERIKAIYDSDWFKEANERLSKDFLKGWDRHTIENTKFDTPKEVKNPNENAWDNFDWSNGEKYAGGLPYTADDDPFGADDSGDDWEDDSDIVPGDFPFPTATKSGDTKVASAKRDKDYSLGAYVGGTTSKTSKKKKKKKNTMVASYKLQGKLISEGWASPKHTDIDKDEKKRWFSEKDIKPEYPKEKPPKMVNGYHPKLLPQLDTPIPYIKVKNKDLLRNHKLTKDEAQKWTSLIDKLNAYIMRNPNMLAYARERYPKSDPHLAALNYKMDMQLAAADEYIETRFPENKRLYDKLMQATKRSIDLTDPKTFKSRKGKMTSINKLMRVDYVMSEYDPMDKEVKNKRIKSNKKSIGRFFRKPKKKTKSDILKDKMAVLDKEMKKTMPEG
tara:strand:+ start:112 stop:4764 length:4653 start_codon:yes stop_codon:yes gene_type:complete